MTRSPVLLTGSSGLIGGILTRLLPDHYQLSGLDQRPPSPPSIPTLVAHASDLAAILPAFEGQEAVVHLAADPAPDACWESVLANNLVATRQVFEASRLAGVPRIIFASSNHVVGMYERDEPYASIVRGKCEGLDRQRISLIDHTWPVRPTGNYGASKAFGEALGRLYWDAFGIEVACLRIGTVNARDEPGKDRRERSTWCSHRDLAHLVDRCLQAPDLGFQIFFGVSDNRWRFWDISHATEVVGYRPLDDGARV